MNAELLEKLKPISKEEQAILDGSKDVQKDLYTSRADFVVDSGKMLEKGKLIDIRLHTRFIHSRYTATIMWRSYTCAAVPPPISSTGTIP